MIELALKKDNPSGLHYQGLAKDAGTSTAGENLQKGDEFASILKPPCRK